eukprot:TRINITY_DN658_c0_g1::TRINITY_DN658_c0_g1_i1::g.28776::m.28776 TRINITY_DN658_c0_g1::TRINITY_DN658_c0_g1_i1::g.28776  ORF type:complete len:766 (-),score=133.29,sp/Q9JIP7/S15A1_MOUSE/35.60/1e-65,sp/Q9JIP7/S15A1_MOUSE/39.39/1e-11,PTR2/PF00854.16/2e-52,MFS_1/PF07690.11/6.6e-11,MFS_1/PF07690.11/1e+02,PAE/PF03283.8/0.061 TRINITY_DN658_c0_g1_i1:369-2666(-)
METRHNSRALPLDSHEQTPLLRRDTVSGRQPQRNSNPLFEAPIYFILGQVMLERFSLYGIKTILPIYLKDELDYSENTSIAIINSWKGILYLLPLIGAPIADVLWGRFRTISRTSTLYILSAFSLAISSISSSSGGSLFGIFILAACAGAIKPCISAFGGDQFSSSQTDEIAQFFSWFYIAINIGSLPAQIILPIIRVEGSYEAAFFLCASIMALATCLFYLGAYTRPGYKLVQPHGSELATFLEIVYAGTCNKMNKVLHRNQTEMGSSEHWLDSTKSVYPSDAVEDTKKVTQIMYLFLPFPVFWALYDQYDTRWIFQAQRLDRDVGSSTMPEESMVTITPILVILFVPLFSHYLYPNIEALFRIQVTPLMKFIAGMFIAGLAFICSAVVEEEISERCDDFCDATYDEGCDDGDCIDPDGEKISVWCQLPQFILIASAEVLLSVTGYHFAYTRAPVHMKSVITAAWLIMKALGNFIIVILAASDFMDRMAAAFFSACLIWTVALLFLPMAMSLTAQEEAESTSKDKVIFGEFYPRSEAWYPDKNSNAWRPRNTVTGTNGTGPDNNNATSRLEHRYSGSGLVMEPEWGQYQFLKPQPEVHRFFAHQYTSSSIPRDSVTRGGQENAQGGGNVHMDTPSPRTTHTVPESHSHTPSRGQIREGDYIPVGNGDENNDVNVLSSSPHENSTSNQNPRLDISDNDESRNARHFTSSPEHSPDHTHARPQNQTSPSLSEAHATSSSTPSDPTLTPNIDISNSNNSPALFGDDR